MKKYLFGILVSIFYVPSVFAATALSEYSTTLDKYESMELTPLKITSTSDNDITANYGISIMLDSFLDVLWDESSVSLSGTAVEKGRIKLDSLVYAKDYKSVYIPVEENFALGDTLQISGLALRAYDQDFKYQHLGVDLNGDMIADLVDGNGYRVTDNTKTDHTAPYSVQDLSYKVNEDQSISLTWNRPPDYDYYATIVNRIIQKDGFEETNFLYNDYNTQFLDIVPDLSSLQSLKYRFNAVDVNGNWSDPLEIMVDLNSLGQSSDVVPPESSSEDQQVQAAEEDALIDMLKKKLNYFYLRYEADCNSGVANDYACLWARIRLIHAQKITHLIIVANLNLSQADLDRMALGRKWPELRYQNQCQLEGAFDPYCQRLKEDLDRLSYFLD